MPIKDIQEFGELKPKVDVYGKGEEGEGRSLFDLF